MNEAIRETRPGWRFGVGSADAGLTRASASATPIADRRDAERASRKHHGILKASSPMSTGLNIRSYVAGPSSDTLEHDMMWSNEAGHWAAEHRGDMKEIPVGLLSKQHC